jgi:alkanesulfonate monooxygenase SsuD/methylene tetrahydromethanopterin reductase-like flavin-dependent oxidoreductase (luciferase family)
MVELTARHADAWNWAWVGRPSHARLVTANAALDEACRRIGRDPASVERTVGVEVLFPQLMDPPPDPAPDPPEPPDPDRVLAGSVEEVARGLAAFAEAGWDHVIVSLEQTTEPALELLAEAVERSRA